jgi:hypothetical protein
MRLAMTLMIDGTHQVYGVRYHHEHISVGDTCPPAIDDGIGEELGGTCAINLDWDHAGGQGGAP